MGEEGLLERPSDLRYWKPTDIGFVIRPGIEGQMKVPPVGEGRYLIVNELGPNVSSKGQVMAQMRELATLAGDSRSVVSFLVLDRGEGDADESVYVFSLFEDKATAKEWENAGSGIWSDLEAICLRRRRTTWRECGIGFIGR